MSDGKLKAVMVDVKKDSTVALGRSQYTGLKDRTAFRVEECSE